MATPFSDLLKKFSFAPDKGGLVLPDPYVVDGEYTKEYLQWASGLHTSVCLRREIEKSQRILLEGMAEYVHEGKLKEAQACQMAANAISAFYGSLRNLAEQYEKLASDFESPNHSSNESDAL